MTKRYIFFYFVIALFFISCPYISDKQPPREIKPVQFTGRVLSIIDHTPIGFTRINIDSTTVTTDAEGRYSFRTPEIPAECFIKATCSGYLPYQKPLAVIEKGSLNLDIYMLPVGVTQRISPAAFDGNTIFTVEGASVSLPPLTGITEDLDVSVTYIDVATDKIECAPGNLSAIDQLDNEVTLVSKGMINVDIKGAISGKPYTLQDYGNFIIDIPIAGDPAGLEEGGTIPLWYFDTATGKWREEGFAVKTGSVYRGTVTHFTTWNADFKFVENTCISGTIVDPYRVKDETYRIELTFDGFKKQFQQNDLSFSVIRLPRNQEMSVMVTKTSTGEVWRKNIITSDSETCLDIGSFPGADYLPEVHSLVITGGENTINLQWRNPVHPDLAGVQISYKQTGSAAAPVILEVDRCTESYGIHGLADGYYTVTVKAKYIGKLYSRGLTKVVKSSAFYGLNIILDYQWGAENDPDKAKRLFIRINNSPAGFFYMTPLLFSPGTIVHIEARLEDIYPCSWYWTINGNDDYEDDLDFTVNEDNEIILHYYYNTCFPS